MEGAMGPHQQQYQQPRQPQRHDPRLLLELPAPALRRVMQLTSTSSNPALCTLCCVSKALRAAAQASAAALGAWIHGRPGDGTAGVAAWLRRYSLIVHKLQVSFKTHTRYRASTANDLLAGHDLLQALMDGAAAAAAAVAPGGMGGALVPGGGAQEQAAGQAAPAHPLQRLCLWDVFPVPPLFNAVANFSRVQVLVLSGGFGSAPGNHTHIQQQLLEALSNLRQLRKLALITWPYPVEEPGHELLLALPPTLQALDLRVFSEAPISRSSLGHLVHLTSLHLGSRISIIDDPQPGPQQQQQLLAEGMEGLGLVAGGQLQQGQVAPAAAQQAGDGLLCLAISPTLQDDFWFTPSSVEAVELLLYDQCTCPSLAALAACPRLRYLRLEYNSRFLPPDTGVSALTQLTGLRLQVLASGVGTITTQLWREVAALSQLQQLELHLAHLVLMQPHTWQPSALQKLVVFVSLYEVVGVAGTGLPWPTRLIALINGWRQNCSSSSSGGGGGGSSGQHGSSSSDSNAAAPMSMGAGGGSSGGSTSILERAPWGLRLVELRAFNQSSTTRLRPAWRIPEDKTNPVDEKFMGILRQAAADMAAALPWLEVTCGADTDTSPCWTAEEEMP